MRKIALIGDTHVGSRVAVAPPEWEDPQGGIHHANPAQLKLFEYWTEFWNGPARDVDTIIHMADGIEGNNRKEFGRLLTPAELNLQIEMARLLFEPYVHGRTVLGVRSSHYHGSLDMDSDKAFMEAIGGEYLGALANVRLEGTDVIANLTHAAGGAVIYRATAADRESLFMDASEQLKLPFHCDLMLRGHWHWYLHLQNSSRHIVFAPCWKLWFDWKIMCQVYGRKQPDVGGVVLDIECKDINVKSYIYPYIMLQDALIVK